MKEKAMQEQQLGSRLGRSLMRFVLKLGFVAVLSTIAIICFSFSPSYFSLRENKITMMRARQGDPEAQYRLAKLYHDKKSMKKAFYWYKQSAEKGYTDSEYDLAWCYMLGSGTPKNDKEGVKCLQKIAENVVDSNLEEKWKEARAIRSRMKRSAAIRVLMLDFAFIEATLLLAEFYKTGVHVEKSTIKSAELYKRIENTNLYSIANRIAKRYKTAGDIQNAEKWENLAKKFAKNEE